MMDDKIVQEESARLLRGMVPLALICFAGLVLFGVPMLHALLGIVLGCAFAYAQFRMICKNAMRAILFPAAQGQKIARKGYYFRYFLAAVFLVLAIKIPFIHPVAATLPLFFPKIVYLTASILSKKGG